MPVLFTPHMCVSSLLFAFCLLCAPPALAVVLMRASAAYVARPITTPPAGVPLGDVKLNINAGGMSVGRFVADDARWLVGSSTTTLQSPDARIAGAETHNVPIYRSTRFATAGAAWGYDIPMQRPGVYDCTAHFAEIGPTAFRPGARVFNLSFATLRATADFPRIDVVAHLGASKFTAFTKTAANLVVPGILAVRLTPIVGDAALAGLTCERVADLPTDVRIDYTPPLLTVADVSADAEQLNVNCGGDAVARFEADDDAWVYGATAKYVAPPNATVVGAEAKNAPALTSHRYGLNGGAFSYRLPLPTAGIYECSLHFAEIYKSASAVGARVFDIDVMGQVVNALDVYAEAGGNALTSVVKTFFDLRIDHTLVITFTPKVSDAFVSAITCVQTMSLPDSSPDAMEDPSAEPTLEETPTPILPVDTPAPTLSADAQAPILPADTPAPSVTTDEPAPSVAVVLPSPDSSLDVSPSVPPAPSSPSSLPSSLPSLTAVPMRSVTPSAVVPSPQPASTYAEDDAEDEDAGATAALPSSSPEPSDFDPPQSTPDIDESAPPFTISPEPTSDEQDPDTETPTPASLANPDVPLTPSEGQDITSYVLRATVGTDGVFTEDMKRILKEVSASATNVTSSWALIELNRRTTDETRQNVRAGRQLDTIDNEYDLTLEAMYAEAEVPDASETYREFITVGNATDAMANHGFSNVEIQLREGADGAGAAARDESQRTSIIVIVTVVSAVVVLAAIAVLAFLASSRWKNRQAAANFDAPPPPMSESDASEELERSDSAPSLEYLDDDSTYTAATSRAGEHADNVGYIRDVCGRGTASIEEDAAHLA